MNIKETAESITLSDLLSIASPITLASIIMDVDINCKPVYGGIREVCWRELVNNVGEAESWKMVTK